MKNQFIFIVITLLFFIFSCSKKSKQKHNVITNTYQEKPIISTELEPDIITIQLVYYGWMCSCPQWVTIENYSKSIQYPDSNFIQQKDFNFNIQAASDTIEYPLIDNIQTFEFIGQFYKESQPYYDENSQAYRTVKTFLFYEYKKIPNSK